MDVVLLSRLQFAFTIMFHYLFPPLTIGLGVVIAYLLWRYYRTGDALYGSAGRFWTRIFALNFALGVATGIVMEFEFGTNWAFYSRYVGDVFGSALAAEGIFAFFLESGFLAILVFGWERVSRKMLFVASLFVFLGSVFSSVWIVVANSWQQTPAGSRIVQRTEWNPPTQSWEPVFYSSGEPAMRAEIESFWAMVFNPSTVHRLSHVLLGCFIMGSFLVMSISAWYLLRRRHEEFARRSFRGALVLGTLAALGAVLGGHLQTQNLYQNQPAKLAAFEGHYRTGPGHLTLIGIPNDEEERVDFAVKVPNLLSFLLFDDFSGRDVIGLDRFRPEDRPPTLIPFIMWRVMIGSGTYFVLLTLYSSFLWWRGTLFAKRWLLWVFVFSVIPAVAANQAGWIAAEVGRQPWIVHPVPLKDDAGEFLFDDEGYLLHQTVATLADGTPVEGYPGLRTVDGISESLQAHQVVASIIMFGVIYLGLGAVWIWVLHRKIQHGPEEIGESQEGPLLEVVAGRVTASRGLLDDPEPQTRPGAEGRSE